MRLPFPVIDEADFSLKPLGAFYAVMLAQAWQVLGGLSFFKQFKMSRGEKICLDLVKVSGGNLSVYHAHDRLLNVMRQHPYLVLLRVFVIVRLFVTPIVITILLL